MSDRLRPHLRVAALLGGLALSTAAHGEPALAPALPTDPVLAALIAQSLAARPEIAAARADVSAARERVPQVRAMPDPQLALGVQNDGFTSWEVGHMETSFYSIMASQTLPWPRKRRLRGQVAALDVDQAAQVVTRVRLDTEAAVRRGYLALQLTRDRLVLLERLEALWDRSAAIARLRYETGEGTQADVLRAPLERNRLRQRRWALEAELATQTQGLNRLRGEALDAPIEPALHLAELPVPALRPQAALEAEALARSPELAAARLGVTQGERAIALARTATLPDPTISIGVMPRPTHLPPMWTASVSVPLPLFGTSKQRHGVAEAEARRTSTLRQGEALAQALRLRAAQRRTALAYALQSIALYHEGLLVQSNATVDSTLTQYEVGKATLAAVLDASAGLIADQDGYLLAIAQAHLLEIDRLEVGLAAVAAPLLGGGGRGMPGTGSPVTGAPGAARGGGAPGTAASAAGAMGGM